MKKYYLKFLIIIKENRSKEIYNIDNCYKKYFPKLYLELLGIYNLSELHKLIYRKNYYDKIIIGKNYRQETKNILSIENISNYSLYSDEKYLNKKRIKKNVIIVINIIMDVKNYK